MRKEVFTMNEEVNSYDFLKEALIEKYNRLNQIVNDPNVKAEERQKAEVGIVDVIKELQKYNDSMDEYTAKAEERRITEEQNKRMEQLERDKLAEHTKVEEMRNQASLELEKQKQKLNWKRVAFELGKIAVPILLSGAMYFKAEKDILHFEESGSIRSKPGRELRLPKFW